MLANVTFSTIVHPFVICTNIGVNALTRLFYSLLKNPDAYPIAAAPVTAATTNVAVKNSSLIKKALDQKTLYAAHFHYIVKAAAYNTATAYLAWKVLKALSGNSPIGPSIAIASITLFVRSVLAKSLSAMSVEKDIAKDIWQQVTSGDENLEELSFTSQAYTVTCLINSRTHSAAKNLQWKEDLLTIQGYPVLKNWPQATYNFVFSRFR